MYKCQEHTPLLYYVHKYEFPQRSAAFSAGKDGLPQTLILAVG